MAEYIRIPELNPLRLFIANSGVFAVDLLPSFEIQKEYCQKYEFADLLNIQFGVVVSGTVNIEAYLITNDGTQVKSLPIYTKLTPAVISYTTYEIKSDFTSLSEGIYYLYFIIRTYGIDDVEVLSEPIYVKETHENTMLLKYYNEKNKFDVIFDETYSSRIEFYLRVVGGFLSDGFKPASKDTFYTNQINDEVQISSVPFSTQILTIGGSDGIPNWVIEKVNRSLSCSHNFINGVQYAKFQGAKFEPARGDKYYPFSGWQIEMIESKNKYSNLLGIENSTVIGYDTNAIGFDTSVIGFIDTI